MNDYDDIVLKDGDNERIYKTKLETKYHKYYYHPMSDKDRNITGMYRHESLDEKDVISALINNYIPVDRDMIKMMLDFICRGDISSEFKLHSIKNGLMKLI